MHPKRVVSPRIIAAVLTITTDVIMTREVSIGK